MTGLRIVDVEDAADLGLLPPCADPRFDHRTCDYWEDADRGSRDARPALLAGAAATPPRRAAVGTDNPFASSPASERRRDALAALLSDDHDARPPDALVGLAEDDLGSQGADAWNPFAATVQQPTRSATSQPRKLSLLTRGQRVFGSYARVAIEADRPVGYVQFGPLSAYTRAQRIRELYPQLPSAPLPAVITCVATTAEARGRGHARHLVEDVCDELARRGFSAVEVFPDMTQPPDGTSAAAPGFWEGCGFTLVVTDEHFPVLRRELA